MVDVIGGGPVAPSAGFITLSDLKDYLAITGTENDQTLQLIVDGVNAAILSAIGRPFWSQQFTEYLSGSGFTTNIYTRNFPLTAVDSIEVNGGLGAWETVPSSSYTITSTEEDPRNVGEIFTGCLVWPKGHNNIRITYTAGYTEPPADLKLAALQFANEMWNLQKDGGKNLQSEKLGDWSYTLMDSRENESLLSARQAIERYKVIL